MQAPNLAAVGVMPASGPRVAIREILPTCISQLPGNGLTPTGENQPVSRGSKICQPVEVSVRDASPASRMAGPNGRVERRLTRFAASRPSAIGACSRNGPTVAMRTAVGLCHPASMATQAVALTSPRPKLAPDQHQQLLTG